MQALKIWCTQHRLWLCFGIVIVSLLLSLGLQYRALTSLESASVGAHKGGLKNYLDAVATDVAHFYRTNAERALHLTDSDISHERLALVQPTFKQAQGAQLFFVALMPHGTAPALHLYQPSGAVVTSAPDAAVEHAISVALAPWQLLSTQGTGLERIRLSVDEHDPDHRMILKPLTDDDSRLIGVMGMMVDATFLLQHYLPQVMHALLPQFCSQNAQNNAIVALHDAHGHVLLATREVPDTTAEVSRPLEFLFTDWRLGIWNRYVTPEQWGRLHFAINVTLSIVLTLALIAGMMLALRTTTRAVRLAQMQTDFVANVSHELRTPLASIRVFAELLRLGRVRGVEKMCEYGAYIETESRRLTQLINTILDFAKSEAQEKTYQFELADVQALVADTLQSFAVHVQQDGYRVEVEAPDEAIPPVLMDPDAIAQALTNVLDNAVKYSGNAHTIGVRLGQRRGYSSIAVTDRGIGIPPEEHTNIFERFYRVSTGLVHPVKGSGLGLAIVQHIMAAHHGQVTLESTPGQGSTFTLHLPVANLTKTAHLDRSMGHVTS